LVEVVDDVATSSRPTEMRTVPSVMRAGALLGADAHVRRARMRDHALGVAGLLEMSTIFRR